jgi:nicotinamidase-related amidase
MINMVIDLFRERKLPVFSIYHTDPSRGPSPDSQAFAYDPAIKITSDDVRIVKNFPNSFNHTQLERILHDAGCDTVFLCGLSSTGCVLATYYGAKDLGFKTFLIKDALLGPRVAYTDCIEDFCDSVNVNVLQSILEGLTK